MRCACGEKSMPPGALALIDPDGIQHEPNGAICFDTEGEWFALSDAGEQA